MINEAPRSELRGIQRKCGEACPHSAGWRRRKKWSDKNRESKPKYQFPFY
jgi:hypothetical protein